MPLVPAGKMMEVARDAGYAVGYFESWDLPSLQGVVDAAEESRSPVILGFNGEFLSRPGRGTDERLEIYAAVGRAAAESAAVPCALIFNECPDDSRTKAAVALGFNLVMPVAGDDGLDRYAGRVADIVRLAHARGACVEAEIGELPHAAPGHGGTVTDPDAAARFVEATGVDLLAVSVGNVHIMAQGRSGLDLERLRAIRDRVAVPLVLHGGTGIDEPSLVQAIELGVAKVNFGTYLKRRYLETLRRRIGHEEADPHVLLGRGGSEDLLVACRHSVRDAVLERIDSLACRGRA